MLALLLHGAAVLFQFALVEGFEPKPDESIFHPRIVRATLIVYEEQGSANTMVTPPVISPDIPLPEKESALAPEEEPDHPEMPEEYAEINKRLQTLEELRDSTLENDISETLQSLAEVAVDEESESFVNAIHTAIVAKWDRPPSARRGMEAVLQVELFPTGELNTVNVIESSGHDAFDRSAEKAVRDVKRFKVPENTELFEKNFRVFNLRFKPEDLLR